MNASLSMLHGKILQLNVLQALFTPFTLGEMSSVITENENRQVFAVSFTLNIRVQVI